MKKNNKKCIVCGKSYTYCTNCSAHAALPVWMNMYHDENCKKIFDIASDFLRDKISKEEAKKAFDKCDLSNKENFDVNIIDAIDKAYDNKKTVIVLNNSDEVKEHENVVEDIKKPKKKNIEKEM